LQAPQQSCEALKRNGLPVGDAHLPLVEMSRGIDGQIRIDVFRFARRF
jgi:hypothetical protein